MFSRGVGTVLGPATRGLTTLRSSCRDLLRYTTDSSPSFTREAREGIAYRGMRAARDISAYR